MAKAKLAALLGFVVSLSIPSCSASSLKAPEFESHKGELTFTAYSGPTVAKYLADNDFKNLSGKEIKEAIEKSIKEKDANLVGNMASQGTTPRQLTDLIGSLCDLTSGSGDKGTPIVLVQGYFDNYTND